VPNDFASAAVVGKRSVQSWATGRLACLASQWRVGVSE
jgi:hypothetical protein